MTGLNSRKLPGISGIELIIFALLGNQLIMRTTFNDTSVFQYHDAVTVFDG